VRRTRQNASIDSPESALLADLLVSPIDHEQTRFQPVALRSAKEQRRHALRNYLRRTWVDAALHNAERLLMLAAFAFFMFWFVDGPLRDQRQREAAFGAPLPTALPTQVIGSVALPMTSPATSLARVPLPYIADGARATAPTGETTEPADNRAVAGQKASPQPTRLRIPAIGVDTPVKEVFVVDGAWEVAEYAAGYLNGTALPGDGNTALAGHAGIRGAVFRDLGKLAPGDDVYLDAGGKRYHYRVRTALPVWPTQTEVLDPSPQPVLTLITCVNWDTQRLIVMADLVNAGPTNEARAG
jgi:sortase A